MKRSEKAALFARKARDAQAQLLTEQDPVRRGRLERAVAVWGAQAKDLTGLSRTHKRAIVTTSLCACFSALYLAPAAVADFVGVSGQTATAGVLGPAAVSAVFWLAKGAKEAFDARKRGSDGRHGQLQVALAERDYAAQNRAGAR